MLYKILPLLALGLATPALAVDIIAMDIPGVHVTDGTGEYDKILLKVPQTKLTVESVKRAFQKFDQCPNCCISPVNKNPEFYDYAGDSYIASKPMNLGKVYIFSAPGKPAVSDLSALKGKTVGARLGMPYGKTVTAAVKLDLVNTDIQNINLLKSNRIDYMIAYVPDAYDAFKSLGIEPYPHVKDKPINIHEDGILCKKNAETQAYIEKLNASIK